MFQFLQVRSEPRKIAPDPESISIQQLLGDAHIPMSLQAVNHLSEPVRRRLYRTLLPHEIAAHFQINLFTWKGRGPYRLSMRELKQPGLVNLSIHAQDQPEEVYFQLELQDNAINGIDLNLITIADPTKARFTTDINAAGQPTAFGTIRRNLETEQQALLAGLSPGQTRQGLRASQAVLTHIEVFLTLLGQPAVFLEPLTYTSAWVFERSGYAYIRGHQLMDEINRQFKPGGKLHAALDGSTPFRQPEAWQSVRGRAWAIHDGILSEIDARWNDLRMVKQVGKHAQVCTFPDASF